MVYQLAFVGLYNHIPCKIQQTWAVYYCFTFDKTLCSNYTGFRIEEIIHFHNPWEVCGLWTDHSNVEFLRKIALYMLVKQQSNFHWKTLQWRHNALDGVSNHQPHHCLPNRLFRRRSKKTSKLRVTGLFVGNSPVTGEFPSQMASYAENVSTWWRHHDLHRPQKAYEHWSQHHIRKPIFPHLKARSYSALRLHHGQNPSKSGLPWSRRCCSRWCRV